AEAHAQHALLTRRKHGERARRGLAQVGLDRGVDRLDGVMVLDEIAEAGILFITDRRLERERLLGNPENLPTPLERYAELPGQLLWRRVAADLVEHLPRRAHDLADGLDHVHGDTDGARLVGGASTDRLADPPGGVGRELVATAILELVD